MKRKITALLLSALVLPGLGQLYLGQKAKGITFIMAINLLLMAALFFAMKVTSPLIGVHIGGGSLTPAMILEQIQPYSFWAKLLLAAFSCLWSFSIVDIINTLRKTEPAP